MERARDGLGLGRGGPAELPCLQQLFPQRGQEAARRSWGIPWPLKSQHRVGKWKQESGFGGSNLHLLRPEGHLLARSCLSQRRWQSRSPQRSAQPSGGHAGASTSLPAFSHPPPPHRQGGERASWQEGWSNWGPPGAAPAPPQGSWEVRSCPVGHSDPGTAAALEEPLALAGVRCVVALVVQMRKRGVAQLVGPSPSLSSFPVSPPCPLHPSFSAWESDVGSRGLCAPVAFGARRSLRAPFPVCRMGKVQRAASFLLLQWALPGPRPARWLPASGLLRGSGPGPEGNGPGLPFSSAPGLAAGPAPVSAEIKQQSHWFRSECGALRASSTPSS